MHEHKNPFLSAAAIRRILALHSFSEANRAYLIEEAERRETWEREVEALMHEVLPPHAGVSPSTDLCEVAGAEIAGRYPTLVASDPSSIP
ncbi:MAG TPA: hypothetical protein GX715_19050 [Armatimonadetes bacterium]|jgi:hypothetical protein|nr:hypothetical protein [Armatimonadota bacterium]